MLEPVPNNYLAKRSQELNLGRADILRRAQALLDGLWAGQTRALSLNGGVLKVVTPNASVASELRLRQVQLIKRLAALSDQPIERLHIQIRTLN